MRIGNRRLLEILVHGRAAFLVAAFDFDRYLSTAGLVPLQSAHLMDQGLVLLRIDLNFEVMRRDFGTGNEMIFKVYRSQLNIYVCC